MQIKIMSTKLHKLEIILCINRKHNNLAFHNTTKYTYLSRENNPPIGCRRRTFHPTIGSYCTNSLCNRGHPQAEAMNPQGKTLPMVGSNSLLIAQFLGSQSIFTPTTIPIHNPLSHQPCTTQGMGSPSLLNSPSSYPTSLQGSSTGWPGNLTTWDSRDYQL
jgi:hypothetical protein